MANPPFPRILCPAAGEPRCAQGRRHRWGEAGSFDSTQPLHHQGPAPAGISSLTVETLMGRSYDEPFSLYGLLAESIDTDDSPALTSNSPCGLRGAILGRQPVTVEDVMWSFENPGHGRQPALRRRLEEGGRGRADRPRSVRFTFNTEDRELPLILGLRPVLQKAQWQGKAFDEDHASRRPSARAPMWSTRSTPASVITYKRNP
jgi:peptide/nickel transport system substrate-binding protein